MRAILGTAVTDRDGGYSSSLIVNADNTFTSAYVFNDLAVAQIAFDARAPGARILTWTVTDADANRQGVTIDGARVMQRLRLLCTCIRDYACVACQHGPTGLMRRACVRRCAHSKPIVLPVLCVPMPWTSCAVVHLLCIIRRVS